MKAYVITTEGEPGMTRLAHFLSQWHELEASHQVPLIVHSTPVAENPHEGCWEAHRTILVHNVEPIIIFEDDAEFTDQFTLDFIYPHDWQMFYFGGQHMQRPLEHSPGIVRCRLMHATHAYAVNDPSKLGYAIGNGRRAAPNKDVSHRIQKIVSRWGWVIYAVHPLTVGQAPLQSVIAPQFVRPQADYWHGERAEPMKGEQP